MSAFRKHYRPAYHQHTDMRPRREKRYGPGDWIAIVLMGLVGAILLPWFMYAIAGPTP